MQINFNQDNEKIPITEIAKVWIGDEEISKQQVDVDVSNRFLYLLQTFYKAAVKKSLDNDVMVRLYFHTIMGAYLKNYTVTKTGGVTDLRCPIIWIQNSGSGKSQLNKVAIDFCRRLGLKATERTSFTETGLIGTYDREKHNFNVKNNLHPGEEVIKTDKQGNQKRVVYQVPIVYGDMYTHDIVFVDEGKILFQPTRYTESVLSILQPALDYPGRVSKKLAAEDPIDYDSTCTLVTTSVAWGDIGVDVMSQGFFPRCLYYYRNIPVEERNRMEMEIHKQLFDELGYHKLINEFADTMEKHKFPVTRERHKIVTDDACLEVLQNTMGRWFGTISERLYGADAHVVQAVCSRLSGFIFKIAGQMAVINNKTTTSYNGDVVFFISHDEMDYSIRLIDFLFNNLINTISLAENTEDAKLYGLMFSIVKEMKNFNMQTISKKDFIGKILVKRSVGRNRSIKIYNSLFTANYFKESRMNGEVYVTPNWAIWLDKAGGKNGTSTKM